jgi:hypothetical protein
MGRLSGVYGPGDTGPKRGNAPHIGAGEILLWTWCVLFVLALIVGLITGRISIS